MREEVGMNSIDGNNLDSPLKVDWNDWLVGWLTG